MSKKIIAYSLLLMILLTGCIWPNSSQLPDDPTVFETGTLEDGDSGYLTILWEGRIYAPYGVPAGLFISRALGPCLGYVQGDENDLIYELAGASPEEYLVEYYQSGLMDNPVIFRELGTIDQPAPDSVESLSYELWEK